MNHILVSTIFDSSGETSDFVRIDGWVTLL
jgi:hypothetical protein